MTKEKEADLGEFVKEFELKHQKNARLVLGYLGLCIFIYVVKMNILFGSLILVLMLLAFIVKSKLVQKVKIFEKGIEVPLRAKGSETRKIMFSDIKNFSISMFQIRFTSEKLQVPYFIENSMMKEADFFNLHDSIHSNINKDQLQTKKQKFKLYIYSALLTSAVSLFAIFGNTGKVDETAVTVFLGIAFSILVLGYIQVYQLIKIFNFHKSISEKRSDLVNAKKLEAWNQLFHIPPLLLFAITLVMGSYLDNGQVEIVDGKLYATYAIGIFSLISSAIFYYAPNINNLTLRAERFGHYFTMGLLLLGSITFQINLFNERLSTNRIETVKSKLVKTAHSEDECYEAIDYPFYYNSDYKLCKKKYPRIREGLDVKVVLREGGLGLKWIQKLELPMYESAEDFILEVGGEDSLLANDLYDYKKGFWDKRLIEWKKRCKKEYKTSCRLLSYKAHLNKKMDDFRKYSKKACDLNDVRACGNLVEAKGVSDSFKKRATVFLQDACKRLDLTPLETISCQRLKL